MKFPILNICSWSLTVWLLAATATWAIDIDPEADAILRAWDNSNQQIQSAVFYVEDSIDEIQPDGTKIQQAHNRTFTLIRPDKLKIETAGDLLTRTLWKDGTTLTLVDHTDQLYLQIADPGTIDDTIDFLETNYDLSLPGSDLLTGNVYATMTNHCDAIETIGIGHVGKEPCHHLLFTGSTIDWQAWISQGDTASLRKLVITYKLQPQSPQYTLKILRQSVNGPIDDDVFTAVLPPQAKRVNEGSE